MAARIRLNHQESVKKRIQASQIVNALNKHAVGKIDMKPTQITAGLGLLRKVLPDLASVSGPGPDGEHEVKITFNL